MEHSGLLWVPLLSADFHGKESSFRDETQNPQIPVAWPKPGLGLTQPHPSDQADSRIANSLVERIFQWDVGE
ncbi:hypothetical protein Y1Q_0011243 [Alligator mississippiensis]|uniref:Uncharacterized protein n=1 Tax=Alligator mississippiensis TaxID=8496 RepID=A0A151N8R6_ALLMI|nr:hypothetical protein Y1Q_0011243 [Alligator mississippiensis]